jgi:hypothetical protein
MLPQEALATAIEQSQRVRRALKRGQTRQVSSQEERELAASFAHSWFNSLVPIINSVVVAGDVAEINSQFRALLEYADRSTTRSKYDGLLKALCRALSDLRRDLVSGALQSVRAETTDEPPDFDSLTADGRMQSILKARWSECGRCVAADAPLAATVMMGGLLEALLVARANKEDDKRHLFASAHAPVDRKTGKHIPFQEWTLKNYIDVGHHLGWITQSAKDIGEVLRDYRNYVHPQKQYSHNIELGHGDASLFWEVTKSIARQLLRRT